MADLFSMEPIARIRSEFGSKFGVPRQSGLVESLCATVVFEPEFRNPDALRGLEGFSHIWLIWAFDQSIRQGWSPTVRPPRLGGNARMGVFATRSPFRPNPIGLSSVVLEAVEATPHDGTVLRVRGRIWWTAPPFWTSSPIFPMWTAARRPSAALPAPRPRRR